MSEISMIGLGKPLLTIYITMKEFLIYKWLFDEYKNWMKEKNREANKSRKKYFQEYYLRKKLESFVQINNPQ